MAAYGRKGTYLAQDTRSKQDVWDLWLLHSRSTFWAKNAEETETKQLNTMVSVLKEKRQLFVTGIPHVLTVLKDAEEGDDDQEVDVLHHFVRVHGQGWWSCRCGWMLRRREADGECT